MNMRKCPQCGELYSETYRSCPFCEEEAALASGHPTRHSRGRRAAKQEPSIMSPVMVLVLLLLAAVLVSFFFGDKIAARLFPEDETLPPSSVQEITPPSYEEEDLLNPDDVPPVDTAPETVDPNAPVIPNTPVEPVEPDIPAVSDPSTLPQTLQLSKTDFTMSVGDAPIPLSVSGSDSYIWYSDNKSVATVDQQGRVTAISSGSANVYAHNSSAAGKCIVRVKGSGKPNTGSSNASIKLSSEDFTLPKGRSHTLSVSGTTAAVTWSSENTAVATVDTNGKVTAVGSSGHTNIVATVDGHTLKCIVRIG